MFLDFLSNDKSVNFVRYFFLGGAKYAKYVFLPNNIILIAIQVVHRNHYSALVKIIITAQYCM